MIYTYNIDYSIYRVNYRGYPSSVGGTSMSMGWTSQCPLPVMTSSGLLKATSGLHVWIVSFKESVSVSTGARRMHTQRLRERCAPHPLAVHRWAWGGPHNALCCFAFLCLALLCVALLCIALPCFALLCIALLCIAFLCIALHCYALLWNWRDRLWNALICNG